VARVLVIDDDSSLLRALRVGLRAAGHEVATATRGQEGLEQTALTAPDVVIVDLGLPDLDGLEVCRRVREWSDVALIVLSATGAEESKIAALNGGADDYVTKPFSMGELEARIRAVLRGRSGDVPEIPAVLEAGSLTIDAVHHEVRRGEHVVDLTAKEFGVLAYLARFAGRTCTYQMILSSVWGPGYGDESAYVHAYVHRLRTKLLDDGLLIETVPGVGYRLRDLNG
jgi:two-component system KDP operon response regulator KdpE